MSEVKQWRELRRELRRAKEPAVKSRLELKLKALEAKMSPKQLQNLREEYECSGPTAP